MGGAMLRGWVGAGMASNNVSVLDPGASAEMQSFCDTHGVIIAETASELSPPDILVLAIKPQMMEAVLPKITSLIGENTAAVSVAAGTTVATMKKHLGDCPVVRSMPNTPSLVGRGMTAAYAGADVGDAVREHTQWLLSAIGKFEWVEDESLLDAVTAVSGSGPAYVFLLAECMAEAGIRAGLPEALAQTLARQTVCGAGELLFQAEDPPDMLRKNVTSPGGTTAAALDVFMSNDKMVNLVEEAVFAAQKRSKELSEE